METSQGSRLFLREASAVLKLLFPFFLLSGALMKALSGVKTPFLSLLGKLCGIPAGCEAVLLPGFLGGYPVGAQAVASAWQSGQISKEQAEEFYGEHKGKVFFPNLVEIMTSAPVVVQVLEAEDAVARYRKIMGATNPAVAEEGPIRKTFALSIDRNTVHGSDSLESAEREISFFFSKVEIFE